MSDDFDIELRLLSQPRYLCVGRAAIGAAVEKLGFGDETSGQVMLAVDEALTNIIRHGYNNADDQPIWLRFKPLGNGTATGFVIVIDDLAEQVDPENIKGRDLDDIKPGGLGVHIIKKIMDDVQYTPRPEGGMRLTLTKNPVANPGDATSTGTPSP